MIKIPKEKNLTVHLSALAAMFIWGVSYIWMKQLFDHMQPATILFYRLIISAFFLYIMLIISGKREVIKLKHIPYFLLSALFNPFLYFMGESHGLQLVSPTISAVIIGTIPVFTPFFAWLVLREKLSTLNLFGLMVSFAGILIMLITKDFSLSADPMGVLFLFGAVASAIIYGILLKKLTLLYHALTIVWIQNLIGIFYFLPVALIKEYDSFTEVSFSVDVLLPMVFLGVFSSSLAFVLFTTSVKHLGIARANIYTNMIPVFTAFFSILLLADQPGLKQWSGMLLVIGGVVLSQKRKQSLA